MDASSGLQRLPSAPSISIRLLLRCWAGHDWRSNSSPIVRDDEQHFCSTQTTRSSLRGSYPVDSRLVVPRALRRRREIKRSASAPARKCRASTKRSPAPPPTPTQVLLCALRTIGRRTCAPSTPKSGRRTLRSTQRAPRLTSWQRSSSFPILRPPWKCLRSNLRLRNCGTHSLRHFSLMRKSESGFLTSQTVLCISKDASSGRQRLPSAPSISIRLLPRRKAGHGWRSSSSSIASDMTSKMLVRLILPPTNDVVGKGCGRPSSLRASKRLDQRRRSTGPCLSCCDESSAAASPSGQWWLELWQVLCDAKVRCIRSYVTPPSRKG